MIGFNSTKQSEEDFRKGEQYGIDGVLGALEDIAVSYAVNEENEKYKIAREIWNKLAAHFPAPKN